MNLQNTLELFDPIDQALAEMISDEQDAAEKRGEFSPGFFGGDNEELPICVPEDAAPELDAIRGQLQVLRETLAIATEEKDKLLTRALAALNGQQRFKISGAGDSYQLAAAITEHQKPHD